MVGWAENHPNLHIVLAAEQGIGAFTLPHGVHVIEGNVINAMQHSPWPIAGRDAYVAGPPGMIRVVLEVLHGVGLALEQIHVDGFGAA